MPEFDPKGGGGTAAPLAALCQVRMLQEMLRHPASNQFNVSLSLQIRGPLSALRLEAAALRTVARHAALRTDFAMAGREVRQLALEPTFTLRRLDVPHGDERFRNGAIAAIVRAEMAIPVPALGGRLLRGLLIRNTATDHVLVLTFHHLAVDGRSIGVFVTDLLRAYDSLSGGHQPALLEPATPFAAAPHLAEALEGGPEWREQSAFWIDELSVDQAESPLGLSGGRPRRAIVRLPANASVRARALAKRAEASLAAVYLAGVLHWSKGLSGADRRRVAVQVDRRTVAALDTVVGPLATTLPLKFETSAASAERLVDHVQRRLNEGYLRLDVPIERAVAAWSATASAVGDPGPSVLFSFDRPYAPPPVMMGLQWSAYRSDRRWAAVPEDIGAYEAVITARVGDAEASFELISGGSELVAAARSLGVAMREVLAG